MQNAIKVAVMMLIVLFLAFGGLGFYFMSQVGSLENTESLVFKVDKLRRDRDDYLQKISVLEAEIEELGEQKTFDEWDTKVVKTHVSRLDRQAKSLESLKESRTSHVQALRSIESRIDSLLRHGEPGAQDGANLQALREERDKLDAEYQRRREQLKERVDELSGDTQASDLEYQQTFEERRKERDRLETGLVRKRDELQEYMLRDPPGVEVSHDGTVITIDVDSRMAVLDIGERHGVKRGMRFEVFQVREGTEKVHKGYVVVRSLGLETATCIVIDTQILLPRCPVCGYTSRYPEERFCPYCTGSAGGMRLQRLTAIPKRANMGMDSENPIVEGDLAQNPLFASGQRLHFAVKGDPDSPLSPKFNIKDFVSAIKWHGGIIDAEVTAQTDILLAGKYATDDVRKARELGVRMLGQYELFDFLRN